jgi:hypothetical protein
MLVATCHCGSVRLEVPRRPRRLTSCNCSICRRTGALWAYYKVSAVRVIGAPGAMDEYIWGDRMLRLVRCGTCGCVTHSQRIDPAPDSRMGINARNLDPAVIASIPVRHFDGASSWKFLD